MDEKGIEWTIMCSKQIGGKLHNLNLILDLPSVERTSFSYTKKLKLAVPCLIWFIGSPCQLDLLKDLGYPGSGKQEAWTSGQSRFVLKKPMINTEAKILPFQVFYTQQAQSEFSIVHLKKKSYLHVTNSWFGILETSSKKTTIMQGILQISFWLAWIWVIPAPNSKSSKI